ncbi:hypothetical protein [Streptomyces longwoodensis]|uniref:hypothetical protein n=1 Tax=Streptomyces longwoodensis TaxID=68231 RepID=UPI003F4D3D27
MAAGRPLSLAARITSAALSTRQPMEAAQCVTAMRASTAAGTAWTGGRRGAGGHAFDERLTGIDDPAELLAAGFRLSARMADSHPELMQVVRRRGLGHVHSDNGLVRRALRDLQVGIASGRFTTPDPVVALTALGGTLLSLVELRFTRPEVDGDEAAVNLAEMVLRMLGLPAHDAREVARCRRTGLRTHPM